MYGYYDVGVFTKLVWLSKSWIEMRVKFFYDLPGCRHNFRVEGYEKIGKVELIFLIFTLGTLNMNNIRPKLLLYNYS